MQEVGLLNSAIAAAIARQGHLDELIVCDSGFPIPDEVELIDIALEFDVPTVLQTLKVLKGYHSVEKIVMTNDTFNHNQSFFKAVSETYGNDIPVEKIPHTSLKERSHTVKTVIRTGDCTAWGNVLLVSGAGNRWKVEKE